MNTEFKSKNADILYLDSPNNPTGFQFSKMEIKKLIKSFDGMIIIDEAQDMSIVYYELVCKILKDNILGSILSMFLILYHYMTIFPTLLKEKR